MQRQVYEHMHSLNNYGSNAYCSRGLKIMPVYQGKYFGEGLRGRVPGRQMEHDIQRI